MDFDQGQCRPSDAIDKVFSFGYGETPEEAASREYAYANRSDEEKAREAAEQQDRERQYQEAIDILFARRAAGEKLSFQEEMSLASYVIYRSSHTFREDALASVPCVAGRPMYTTCDWLPMREEVDPK